MFTSMQLIDNFNFAGKKAIVRVDFNVPLNKETGAVSDDTRIRGALPTIKKIITDGGAAILMSHMGKPKGEPKPEFSLAPVAKELSRLLGKEVKLAKDVIGEDAENLINNIQEGEIVLLENVRFHREETDNDPEFSKKLASFDNSDCEFG